MSRFASLSGRNLPGGYVLGELLGRGGMGSVYEGTHLPSRRSVAIKVLDPKLARHAAHLERFRREATTTSQLGHRNIVSVEYFDQDGAGIAYYVMERLEGAPLSRILNREGRLPEERAVAIMAQTLAGLNEAHGAGVIHRDLKPSNIFVVDDGRGRELVKVVDFGLAKLLSSDATKLTVTGSVVGTPHYLSPEQARGGDLDPRSDLFACGVILYEMLAGTRPFEGNDLGELLPKIIAARATRVEEAAPETAEGLGDAVHRALARSPGDRFSSAKEMRAVLLESVGLRKKRVARGKRRRARSRKWLLPVLGVGVLLGLAVAVAVVLALRFVADEGAPAASAEGGQYRPPAAVTPIHDEGPPSSETLMAPVEGGSLIPSATPGVPSPSAATPAASPPRRPTE